MYKNMYVCMYGIVYKYDIDILCLCTVCVYVCMYVCMYVCIT